MCIHTLELFDKKYFSLTATDLQKQKDFYPVNPTMPHSFTPQQVQCEFKLCETNFKAPEKLFFFVSQLLTVSNVV